MSSTSDKRRAVAALAAERSRQGSGRRLVTRSLVALAVLVLLGLPVAWMLGFFSTPRAVAEVAEVVDLQVAEYEKVARGEVPYAAAPDMRPVFEKFRSVPPAYRDQAGRQMDRLWEARERAEMGSYFALPPEQRQAELDRRIKAEEQRRAAWQAERERRAQERPAGAQQATARGGPGGGPANGAAGGGSPPPGGRRGATTEEARNERSKRQIDRTTPEQRARRAEYRRAIEERRAQLGLTSGGRRG